MRNLPSILQKIRIWGLKGVFDYFKGKLHNARIRSFLLSNAKQYPLSPCKGITILADMTQPASLSKTMRDFTFALKKAGIPFQTFDLHPTHYQFPDDIGDILTKKSDFRILKYTHVIEMFSSPLPNSLKLKLARIIFWEFTTGLLEFSPAACDAPAIIAMSDFNCQVFRQIFPKTTKIIKIPYPFFFDKCSIPDKLTIRNKYGIPETAFVVFFNFDYGSSFSRKNPDGSIRAFAMAFSENKNAFLVFKTKGAKSHLKDRGRLLRLAADLMISDQLIMIDEYIPQHDIYGLTNACDVYLSLHRGEGFGLGIVEAMSLGKAVVATDYSSIPVPYTIVKVPDGMRDHPCYTAVKEWAEPNIDAAADALCKLHDNETFRNKIGIAARSFVEEHFSTENFKKSMEDFFSEV